MFSLFCASSKKFVQVAPDIAPGSKSSLKFALALKEDQRIKRGRFTEEPIKSILKEREAGVPVSDLCLKDGIRDACIYKWKAK